MLSATVVLLCSRDQANFQFPPLNKSSCLTDDVDFTLFLSHMDRFISSIQFKFSFTLELQEKDPVKAYIVMTFMPIMSVCESVRDKEM